MSKSGLDSLKISYQNQKLFLILYLHFFVEEVETELKVNGNDGWEYPFVKLTQPQV